jgi:VWFA-related protein
MLVDVSSSLEDEIPREQKAATQFFKQVLRPSDQGFVIGFSGQAVLLQDLSSELLDLQDGLADLESAIKSPQQGPNLQRFQAQPFQRGGGGARGGGGGFGIPGTQGPFPGGGGGGRRGSGGFTGTVLYDALYLAANEVLKPVSGRKVIILLSDGQDYGSKVQLTQALEAAVKADALVYSIYVEPDMKTGDGEEIMQRMSDKTGGRLFELGRRTNLEKIFKEIEEELRSQYSISYSPKRGLTGRGFRNIEIRVDRKDYKVQAREGYYPQPAARK